MQLLIKYIYNCKIIKGVKIVIVHLLQGFVHMHKCKGIISFTITNPHSQIYIPINLVHLTDRQRTLLFLYVAEWISQQVKLNH